MLLSWIYELTPEGVVRTEDLDPVKARSVQRRSGRLLDFIIIGALLLVIAMLVVGRLPFYRQTGESIAEKSIAVLPFENLSEDKANAYFADGIQDEILTRLSKIADLKVISRTSTQHYKNAPANLPEIARQLGVAHILEGRVQKSGDTVRVNVQLIKAANDTHVWADTYVEETKGVFLPRPSFERQVVAFASFFDVRFRDRGIARSPVGRFTTAIYNCDQVRDVSQLAIKGKGRSCSQKEET